MWFPPPGANDHDRSTWAWLPGTVLRKCSDYGKPDEWHVVVEVPALAVPDPALESALGTFRGAVRIHPTRDDLANRFELRVLNIDPHADAISWPGPSVSSITEPIDLGPFEDATPARVLFLRRHGLFGGIAGSGKSGGINVLMGNLSACRDTVVWAIDLKRGMELQPWAPCFDRLATTPEQARTLLRDAVAILEGRADMLAEQGRRVWEPTPDLPRW